MLKLIITYLPYVISILKEISKLIDDMNDKSEKKQALGDLKIGISDLRANGVAMVSSPKAPKNKEIA